MPGKVFEVSEVNQYIKNMFRQDLFLNHLQVVGEVSNCKIHGSGHIYFTLKDESSAIQCVMFAGYADKMKTMPVNQAKIIVIGGIGLYEKTGTYQIYVREIQESGTGDLAKRFEELKKKLQLEGIFEKPKKPVSQNPTAVGIVTSETGAAIQDILKISARRNPGVKLILYPSLVQGERAAENIARGIRYFNENRMVDTLIVGRGGGSLEDLWPFNEEEVVRAIYCSKIPVISAVGHETDVTLSDFVADLRASTPSAAAELAIPLQDNQVEKIKMAITQLKSLFFHWQERYRNRIEKHSLQLKTYHPRKKLDDFRMKLAEKEREWQRELHFFLLDCQRNIEAKRKELQILMPQKKKAAFTKGGIAIKSVRDVVIGDRFHIRLQDGSLLVKVEEIIHGDEKENKEHGGITAGSEWNHGQIAGRFPSF